MKLVFDHLVVAARTLDEGVAHVERQLDVKLSPGGQHLFMGTHNALLRLGNNCYLEVIAIDPTLAAPNRPRWFALDSEEMQQKLAKAPRLIHWVAGTSDIVAAQAKLPELLGPVVAASRGNLNWKITIPENGALPHDGAFPTLIEWPEGDHVASKMKDVGCKFAGLSIRHPNWIQLEKEFELPAETKVIFEHSHKIELVAIVNTPQSIRSLS